jgi:hypothetical protein
MCGWIGGQRGRHGALVPARRHHGLRFWRGVVLTAVGLGKGLLPTLLVSRVCGALGYGLQ